MGVYIPNMEKPKNAFNCSTKINPDERKCIYVGKVFEETLSLLLDRPCDDCPLIEIVQCKDCKYGHKHILKDTYDCDKSDITVFHEADFFCKASERRE